MTWFVLCDDYPPLDGGVATWALEVAHGLARHERVVVLARARRGLGEHSAVPVVPVRGPSFARRGGLWMAAALGWRLRSGDTVLATTWAVATHVVGLCGAAGASLHVVYHGSDLTRPPQTGGFDRVARGAAKRWCVSRFLADVLSQRGFEGDVISAPVDLRTQSINDPERWVMVARATPQKGGDRFLRIAAAAGVRAEIVGDGPELDAWRRLAASLGGESVFHGRVSRERVHAVVANAGACFLLPRPYPDGSGAEGLGLTVLEAAALGVPGVGCATGGVAEALGPHGLALTDPDDSEGSVHAIRAWWTADIGTRCRDWLGEHHGVQRTVDALLGR